MVATTHNNTDKHKINNLPRPRVSKHKKQSKLLKPPYNTVNNAIDRIDKTKQGIQL